MLRRAQFLQRPGIAQRAEQTQQLGKIQIIGFDADPQTLAGIEAGNIYATILQDQAGIGRRPFASSRITRGGSVGMPLMQKQTLPCDVVNKNNVAVFAARWLAQPPNLPDDASHFA